MKSGLGVEPVRRLAELAEGGAAPDLTLVLDVPEGVGLSRLTGDPDRMESKGGAFHAEVVRAYRELALEGHGRRLIPSGDLDDATAAIRSEVSSVVG